MLWEQHAVDVQLPERLVRGAGVCDVLGTTGMREQHNADDAAPLGTPSEWAGAGMLRNVDVRLARAATAYA